MPELERDAISIDGHARLSVKQAAAILSRSERTVRRYLHQGLLEADRVDMRAGVWQWQIKAESAEDLRSQLQGGRAGVAMSTLDSLTAQMQALHTVVETQNAKLTELVAQNVELREEVVSLRESQQKLLPPAQEREVGYQKQLEELTQAITQLSQRRPWWRFWQPRKD